MLVSGVLIHLSAFTIGSCGAAGGLLRNAYPGQPGGTIVENYGRYDVLGGNPIVTIVDPDKLSITNTTTGPDHIFCCGYVTRGIVQAGSRIATLNYLAGQVGFVGDTAGIRSYIQSVGQYSSYGAIANPNAPAPP